LQLIANTHGTRLKGHKVDFEVNQTNLD